MSIHAGVRVPLAARAARTGPHRTPCGPTRVVESTSHAERLVDNPRTACRCSGVDTTSCRSAKAGQCGAPRSPTSDAPGARSTAVVLGTLDLPGPAVGFLCGEPVGVLLGEPLQVVVALVGPYFVGAADVEHCDVCEVGVPSGGQVIQAVDGG